MGILLNTTLQTKIFQKLQSICLDVTKTAKFKVPKVPKIHK